MIASRLFFYFILFLVPSFLFAEENYCNYVSNYAEQSLRNHLYAKETYNLQNKRLQKVLLKLDTIKFENFYKKELKETLKKAYKIEAKEDLNETAESIVKFKKLVAHSCSINLKRLLASELKTQNQCNIYSIDLDVKNACLGNANYLNDGKYALMSKYIIQNQCDYIKGIDNTQISYLETVS
ncbi:hypothetical protein QJU96_02105 [Pasteurella skyensis]|uniref:Uncharacterized protein n=1 Tax=Phocoenobacter skyensis TaxID=97481 RepID=A0AAJ6NCH9_9PAST|nr:hypothetical protein [Pasteurella skyensis]MDP8170081.1 hypothetical protein [Pasteurella skyensis]MDP8174263.1 hypothetical protein [Pasteurella skyensis]